MCYYVLMLLKLFSLCLGRCAILLFMLLILLMLFSLCLGRCAIMLFMLFSLWGVLFCIIVINAFFTLSWEECYLAINAIYVNAIFFCLGRCAIFATYAIFTFSWELCYFAIYAINAIFTLSWKLCYFAIAVFIFLGSVLFCYLCYFHFLGRRAILVLMLFVLFSLWGVLIWYLW